MRENAVLIRPIILWLALSVSQPGLTAEPDAAPDDSGPDQTLATYFSELRRQNSNTDLDIYTPATRRMLEDWAMTPAQMDNLVNTYAGCRAEATRIDASQRYAVIRYPVSERQCSPWFFEFVDGGWALDLTMMQRAIRFGAGNAWRFDLDTTHPYDFAFVDWAFDSRGFPLGD